MSATTYANKNATHVSMTSTSGDYKVNNLLSDIIFRIFGLCYNLVFQCTNSISWMSLHREARVVKEVV